MSDTETFAESSRATSQRGRNFDIAEDEQLCKSWIYVSEDLVVGRCPKSDVLWAQIHENFHQNSRPTVDRSLGGLLSRWGAIQRSVSKFCGYIAQVEVLRESGTNHIDQLGNAQRLYHEMEGAPFKLMHCWIILRGAPKWAEYLAYKKKAKEKASAAIAASAPGLAGVEEEKARAATKRPLDGGNDEFYKKRVALLENRARSAEELVQRYDIELACVDTSILSDADSREIIALLKAKALRRLRKEANEK